MATTFLDDLTSTRKVPFKAVSRNINIPVDEVHTHTHTHTHREREREREREKQNYILIPRLPTLAGMLHVDT